jgi:alcohol dehydrogenase (cytochrome c)
MGGRVFRGTADGHLLALDASTGRLIWESLVGDPTVWEFVFGAPLAWNGLVFVGITGSDGSIKGRVMAFDANTGREVWRFNTIPTGNEVGADTWESRVAAETGGGGTWSTFTLDVSSAELFVPVASPAPIFLPDLRPGANLFTSSVVVLDARTGALKWWYQLVPNDTHDLDLAAAPMLYINSEGRRVVAAAGKDGYVHVVDRLTHQLLFKTAVTTIENEKARPSEKETRFCPSSWGGTEWNGPAFDSRIRTIFVGAVDWCLLVKITRDVKGLVFQPGSPPADTTVVKTHSDPDRPWSGWLTALDADTGQVKWKYHDDAPIVAGVTATAAGIVLTGDVAGNFLVFSSATGQVLYKRNTGGSLAGGVITYDIGGQQYIAFTSGNGSRTFFGSPSPPSLVVMALDEKTHRASVQNGAQLAHGQQLYAENCSSCHGFTGEGASAPALRGVKDRRTYEGTLQWIKSPQTPTMPKLYPSPLNDQAVRDVATFIRTF